jgi:hypothetical protein
MAELISEAERGLVEFRRAQLVLSTGRANTEQEIIESVRWARGIIDMVKQAKRMQSRTEAALFALMKFGL